MTDKIGYEALTQAAMRGVVRDVLRQTASNGAPVGDHHFYITFQTKAPGVKIASHLTERFPDEMTIVVQHQYWDLEVHDAHFEIVLKFSGVPQHLHIPFSALTRFVDPAVNFGLSFEDRAKGEEPDDVIAPVSASKPSDQDEASKDTATNGDNTVVKLDAFRRK